MAKPAQGRRRRRALFVDLDGTVRATRTGRPHPVKSWDQEIREGVPERLLEYKGRRFKVVGVTNQGGVAFSYLTENDVEEINRRLCEELLPGLFDLVLYCPCHPKGRLAPYRLDSEDRKPNPGMAFKARDALGLDLARSVMVGDSEDDRAFARNAGIGRFFWEREFFGPGALPEASADAALAAPRSAVRRRRAAAKPNRRKARKPARQPAAKHRRSRHR